MKLFFDEHVDNAQFSALIAELKAQDSELICHISKIVPIDHPEEAKLYMKVQNASHGVLLPYGQALPSQISWAVRALLDSVEGSEAPVT
ncbi:MAG: hypothetical protein HYV16_14760 [Gammaproteobacteria bacterium]|nr:hypothetical protein [Gammaproteobacteria bacterium]